VIIERRERFLKSFSALTGISYEKLENYAKTNNVLNVFEHPYTAALSRENIENINHLRELFFSYELLKMTERDDIVKLTSDEAACKYFKALFSCNKEKERVLVAFLDSGHNVIETIVVSEGTVNQSTIYPREIAKQALFNDSVAIVMAHNHPGGSLNFSQEDTRFTRKLLETLEPLGVRILDHILVGDGVAVSMVSLGQFPTVSRER
jgi:DNA repair protein RadC